MKLSIYAFIVSISLAVSACGGNKQMASAEKSSGELLAGEPPAGNAAVPPCTLKMIDSTKKLDPGLQFTEVRRYKYNGASVYLVAAPCCDQFNPVYDSACNYLFAPSGGFTGKGDRSNPDFFTNAKEDSLIWKRDKN